MTNSDSRSVSEAGSLAKPARLLEDKTSFSVHYYSGKWKYRWTSEPVFTCECISAILYGINCTLLCALTYTSAHCIDEKTPFFVLFALLLCHFIRSCLCCYSPERCLGGSAWEAGACGGGPLCTFLLGGGVFPLEQCSDSTGSPGFCLWCCCYSLFKGFVLVRHSDMEREKEGPAMSMTTRSPVQNMPNDWRSTALPPSSQDNCF